MDIYRLLGLMFLLSMPLLGCGPKRIDGASPESYKRTLESMFKSLSESEQSELIAGLTMLLLWEAGVNYSSARSPEDSLREKLNGKTFHEIRYLVAITSAEMVRNQKEKEEIYRKFKEAMIEEELQQQREKQKLETNKISEGKN